MFKPSKELKSDLAVRPVFHRLDAHVEAHAFLAFVGYRLLVTLKNMARARTPGLTARTVLEKFATMRMVDVHLPMSDGRELVLPRHTQPDDDHRLLLHQLGLRLSEQPPPRIRARQRLSSTSWKSALVVPTFGIRATKNQRVASK